MKNAIVVLLLVLISVPGSAEDQKQVTKKKPVGRRLVLSHYMRRVALLYVENLEGMEKACTAFNHPPNNCMDPFVETTRGLDDRIAMEITTEADKKFHSMLRFGAMSESIYLNCLSMHLMRVDLPDGCGADNEGSPVQASDDWNSCHFYIRKVIGEGYFDSGPLWAGYCEFKLRTDDKFAACVKRESPHFSGADAEANVREYCKEHK